MLISPSTLFVTAAAASSATATTATTTTTTTATASRRPQDHTGGKRSYSSSPCSQRQRLSNKVRKSSNNSNSINNSKLSSETKHAVLGNEMVQAAVILARIHQMQQSPHDHDSIRVRGSTTSERNDNDDDVDECFGEREREQAPLATTTTMMSNNRDDDDDNEHGLQLANLADEDRDATPALATHVSFDSLSSSEHQDENAAVVLQQQQCAPHPNDVLIGHADWPGTIRYHRWIRERKYDFHLAHTKQMRACLAKQVTVLVTARQSPPGRFLYFTLATKIWLPMDHTAVLTEIGKDFRLEAFSTVHVTATACSSPPPPPPRSLVQSSMGPPPTRTAPRYSLPPLPATATALAQRGPPFPRSGNLHPPLLGRMSTPVVPYPGSSTMRGGRDIRLAPPPPPPSFATPRSRHHHHQHRLVGLPLSMAMSQTKHGLHHTHTMPHTTVSEAPPRGHHLLLADKPASVRRSISNDITGDKTMTFADGSVFLPAASRPAPVVRHGSADEYRFVSGSDTTASWDGSMSMYHPNQQQQPLKKARKPHTFWIQEEDERLRHAVAVHGLGKWGVVAQGVTNRTAEQCRYRWTHCVNPDINRAPLTVEECRMILKQHAFHGNKWTKIAKALPGRTDHFIKKYWTQLIRPKVIRYLMRVRNVGIQQMISLEETGFDYSTDQELAGATAFCVAELKDDMGIKLYTASTTAGELP